MKHRTIEITIKLPTGEWTKIEKNMDANTQYSLIQQMLLAGNISEITYSTGLKEFYKKGHLHREDGPAVIHQDGAQEFWMEGRRITEEQRFKEIDEQIKKLEAEKENMTFHKLKR